ncbi:MarR family winged helix-turn-helix transcriptional regulator [Cupriavidus pauculus]|nr:MarR family winged helix-turn-helix transcriptional regulator [Cupriavidus pauculus]
MSSRLTSQVLPHDIQLLVQSGRLRRALQHRLAAALTSFNLSVAKWLVLSLIQRKGEATLTEIAEAFDHDAGAVSRTMGALRSMGLLVSRPAPLDRRSTVLSLSEAGQSLFQAITASTTVDVEDMLRCALGPDELQKMISLMQQAAYALETIVRS